MMKDEHDLPRRTVPGARINANGTISLRPCGNGPAIDQMRGWLSQASEALVGEHTCTPPGDARLPVASHLAAKDGSTYTCPECGQVFASAATAATSRVPAGASNVIPFPGRAASRDADRHPANA